ncbi:hypothetical protein DXG01_004940 [Tephrocybe rancida]|nr:hypothetical protein DXG01_004940 [Tephrocybe rancida]
MLSIAPLLLFLISGLFASSVHAEPVKRTVPQILQDLATVSSQATAFDNAVIALPSTGPATLAQTLVCVTYLSNDLPRLTQPVMQAVHSTITTLTSGLQTTTTDVVATPGPISEAGAQAIIQAVQAIAPAIIRGAHGLRDKLGAFSNSPDAKALMLKDLRALQAALDAFYKALIHILPPDVVQAATDNEASVNAAVQGAITFLKDIEQ